jgi:hypothetical protein
MAKKRSRFPELVMLENASNLNNKHANQSMCHNQMCEDHDQMSNENCD